ncbi:MAG: response regulator [Rhodopila sp.]
MVPVAKETPLHHRKLPVATRRWGIMLPTSGQMNITMPDRLQELQQSPVHTILVVEDDPLVRMPIAEYLRDCGYIVVEAGDAQEAMALIDTDRSVSLVFSDVRMPGSVDGFGLASWIRRHHPDVPVLLTSGYNDVRRVPNELLRSLPIIGKPYSQAAIGRRIKDLLSQ